MDRYFQYFPSITHSHLTFTLSSGAREMARFYLSYENGEHGVHTKMTISRENHTRERLHTYRTIPHHPYRPLSTPFGQVHDPCTHTAMHRRSLSQLPQCSVFLFFFFVFSPPFFCIGAATWFFWRFRICLVVFSNENAPWSELR